MIRYARCQIKLSFGDAEQRVIVSANIGQEQCQYIKNVPADPLDQNDDREAEMQLPVLVILTILELVALFPLLCGTRAVRFRPQRPRTHRTVVQRFPLPVQGHFAKVQPYLEASNSEIEIAALPVAACRAMKITKKRSTTALAGPQIGTSMPSIT